MQEEHTWKSHGKWSFITTRDVEKSSTEVRSTHTANFEEVLLSRPLGSSGSHTLCSLLIGTGKWKGNLCYASGVLGPACTFLQEPSVAGTSSQICSGMGYWCLKTSQGGSAHTIETGQYTGQLSLM